MPEMQSVISSLILNIVNIIILFVILRALVYNPVKKFMAARQERVDADIKGAQEKLKEAQAAKAQRDAELAEAVDAADKERRRILDAAESHAAEITAAAEEHSRRDTQYPRRFRRSTPQKKCVRRQGKRLPTWLWKSRRVCLSARSKKATTRKLLTNTLTGWSDK